MTFSPILNIGKSVSLAQKDKTLTISDEGLLFWWAHQDLNLGPKDYESRHPKKTTRISRGYGASLSVCSVLCSGFNVIRRTADSLFGLENQRNFGAIV